MVCTVLSAHIGVAHALLYDKEATCPTAYKIGPMKTVLRPDDPGVAKV